MTKNKLKTRLSGHQSNINKYTHLMQTQNTDTDRELEVLGERTALIHHMIHMQHNFNLAKTKIVARSYRSSALPILEMCMITNTDNTVNFRTDTCGLSSTYAGILHVLKKSTPIGNRDTNSLVQAPN